MGWYLASRTLEHQVQVAFCPELLWRAKSATCVYVTFLFSVSILSFELAPFWLESDRVTNRYAVHYMAGGSHNSISHKYRWKILVSLIFATFSFLHMRDQTATVQVPFLSISFSRFDSVPLFKAVASAELSRVQLFFVFLRPKSPRYASLSWLF